MSFLDKNIRAKTPARVGVLRVDVGRLGFTPQDIKSNGTEYVWDQETTNGGPRALDASTTWTSVQT